MSTSSSSNEIYKMTSREILLIVGGGVCLGIAIIWVLSHRERFINQPLIAPRKRKIPTNFLVYNYFPKHSISIDIIKYDGKGKRNVFSLIDSIRPKSTSGLTKQQVKDHLQGENVIQIHTISPKGEKKLYTEYMINLDPHGGERIKNLHVGMITTRFIGATDGLRMTTTAGNAISGNASLKIHNLTYLPLNLNGGAQTGNNEDPSSGGGVSVRPHSTDRYLGYLHQGVTLGTIFSDDDGLYPDFQYLEPQSDLYYGVVSDIRQPLSGCFQLEFNDDCEYGQTLWPFQEGIM
jgi:hypothetical protein